jgi:hypothetical protein
MSETTASPYLTTKELAELIRKSRQAVQQMRHRGTGPKGVEQVLLVHRLGQHHHRRPR